MAELSVSAKKSTVRDMTDGSIIKQIILFSLPLMLGNVYEIAAIPPKIREKYKTKTDRKETIALE